MKSRFFIIAFLASALFLGSCKDDNDLKDVDYAKLAEDSQISQEMSEDMSNQVNNETKGGQFSNQINKTSGIAQWKSAFNDSINITLNTNGGVFPMTLTIDFGSNGVTGLDGKVRKGQLVAQFTGLYTEAGTVVTVTPNNYYVNGYKIEGTKTITNNGRNSNGKLSFTEQDINGRIIKPNGGGTITWESTRTNTWVSGEASGGFLGIFDDEYEITGTANGEISDGTDYTIDISAPLLYKVLCQGSTYPLYSIVVDGELTYSLNGTEVAVLDYGNGTCDASGSITYGGTTYNIVVQ
ncbi:MAG: hypothetical protein SFW35_04070 [Chitinophagales bacterium]|nr:hypothetical protein [Chitinophagales bacterium]